MMTHKIANTQVRHLLVMLGIRFVTSLMLIGDADLHPPGFARSSFVHAMIRHALFRPTCQSTQGTQPALCEHQNPQAQGYTTDAQSIEVQDVFSRGMLIGEVDLRYSFICTSFWTRTIAYASAEGSIQAIHARLTIDVQRCDYLGYPSFPQLVLSEAESIVSSHYDDCLLFASKQARQLNPFNRELYYTSHILGIISIIRGKKTEHLTRQCCEKKQRENGEKEETH